MTKSIKSRGCSEFDRIGMFIGTPHFMAILSHKSEFDFIVKYEIIIDKYTISAIIIENDKLLFLNTAVTVSTLKQNIMSQISQEKRNQIAYDFMVRLAMNRKPDTDFLSQFGTKVKGPDDKNAKRLNEEFLSKHSPKEVRDFFEMLFRDGFEKNINIFTSNFDDEVKEHLENQKKESK